MLLQMGQPPSGFEEAMSGYVDAAYRQLMSAREDLCAAALHFTHPDYRDRLIQIVDTRLEYSLPSEPTRGWALACRLRPLEEL